MSDGNAGQGAGNAIKGVFNTAHGIGETIRGTVNSNLDQFGEGITNADRKAAGDPTTSTSTTGNSSTHLQEGSGKTMADHQSTAHKGLDEVKQGIASMTGGGASHNTSSATGTTGSSTTTSGANATTH